MQGQRSRPQTEHAPMGITYLSSLVLLRYFSMQSWWYTEASGGQLEKVQSRALSSCVWGSQGAPHKSHRYPSKLCIPSRPTTSAMLRGEETGLGGALDRSWYT